MNTVKICGSCGKPLKDDAPQGICPECLMKAGLGTESGPDTAGRHFVPPTVQVMAQLFPQFEIVGLIGKGGMGAVYKARQPGLDRLVALKILPPRTGSDPGFAERFTREARALARLSHPSIVAVHDFGSVPLPPELAAACGVQGIQDQRLHYLVMQYVDGPNLRQLEQSGKLSPREALQIIPQICEALQFAHDEGVVHRDIKPENVLLDKKGRIKIADFGLAKILGVEPLNARLTGERDVMGTPHYMAPEQMERPHAVDHRADIYSLGVVFYEMLTGELPLGKFAPPSRKVHIDVRLDEVVMRALENEPARRYQQASEIKTDVETISQAEKLPGQPSPPPQMAEKLDEFRRAVKGPSIGLQVAGSFNLIAMLLISVLPIILKLRGDDRIAFQIFALAFTVFMSLGCLVIVAGLKMKRLESYNLALAGSILAAFVSPIGLPLGIWSLLILTQREVRQAFQRNAAAAQAVGRPPSLNLSDRVWLGGSVVIVCIAFILAAGFFLMPHNRRPALNDTVVVRSFSPKDKPLSSNVVAEADGWSVSCDGPQTIRLFEVPYSALAVRELPAEVEAASSNSLPGHPLEQLKQAEAERLAAQGRLPAVAAPGRLPPGQLLYRARLKSEGLVGRAYLEMWCVFPSIGEAFSRGLDKPVTDSMDWATYQTPFFLKRDEEPNLLRLNLVVEGKGKIFIKDVEVLAGPAL